jgi:hypothetical protein
VPTDPLFRCSRTTHPDPWYFSSDGGGRFDLDSPLGTCYLASDKVGALREVLGPDYVAGSVVAQVFFDQRRIWEATPTTMGWTQGIADLLDDRWDGLGLTNELFTTSDYPATHSWARCFQVTGWDGLRVRLRHLLSPDRAGTALFGPEGAHGTDARFDASASPVAPADRAEFASATGIKVEPTPIPLTRLHVIS